MCQRVVCSVCQKPSYVGCGLHVEQVLADVPAQARCRCREKRVATTEQKPTLLDRLWGKTPR